MKKALLVSILSAGVLLAGSAQANYIDSVTERKLVKICGAFKNNNKIRLHRAIKKVALDIREWPKI
jgi:hypothetical protein